MKKRLSGGPSVEEIEAKRRKAHGTPVIPVDIEQFQALTERVFALEQEVKRLRADQDSRAPGDIWVGKRP